MGMCAAQHVVPLENDGSRPCFAEKCVGTKGAKACGAVTRAFTRPAVITVDDSPIPTRRPCSPFWEIASPSSMMRPARGAGRRSVNMHSLKTTGRYNPSIPHHCGYMRIVKAG